MEAYLPLQIATIAFEVTKGSCPIKYRTKFEKHFAKRVTKVLEKNCINVCNPKIDEYLSRYRKMNYKLPLEIQ